MRRQCRARMDRLGTGRAEIGLNLGFGGTTRQLGAFCLPGSITCMDCSCLDPVPL